MTTSMSRQSDINEHSGELEQALTPTADSLFSLASVEANQSDHGNSIKQISRSKKKLKQILQSLPLPLLATSMMTIFILCLILGDFQLLQGQSASRYVVQASELEGSARAVSAPSRLLPEGYLQDVPSAALSSQPELEQNQPAGNDGNLLGAAGSAKQVLDRSLAEVEQQDSQSNRFRTNNDAGSLIASGATNLLSAQRQATYKQELLGELAHQRAVMRAHEAKIGDQQQPSWQPEGQQNSNRQRVHGRRHYPHLEPVNANQRASVERHSRSGSPTSGGTDLASLLMSMGRGLVADTSETRSDARANQQSRIADGLGEGEKQVESGSASLRAAPVLFELARLAEPANELGQREARQRQQRHKPVPSSQHIQYHSQQQHLNQAHHHQQQEYPNYQHQQQQQQSHLSPPGTGFTSNNHDRKFDVPQIRK